MALQKGNTSATSGTMKRYQKSQKLNGVLYDIRGPVLEEAERLETKGYRILRLNVGNPAPFGFNAPDDMIRDMIINIPNAQGYCDSRGIFSARKAIVHYERSKGIENIDIQDVYIGNGVSELIVMAMQGLLDNGDEILIPSPDYPLWTAAVTLSGGKAVHYRCDEQSEWYPDLEDLRSKVSSRTKGIVVINPNNPTGSLYPRDILEAIVDIALEYELMIFADEIYDRIVYDGEEHTSIASLSDELFFITFNGLSKSHRAAGFRAGWMVLSGNLEAAKDYCEGLQILSNMRLCSNVPAQYTIQTALGESESIGELVAPGGRLAEQRDVSHRMISEVPGISCVKPKGALYLFPKIDITKFGITDDEQMVLDLLRSKHILVVHGRGFNWPEPNHFRIVFLPNKETLEYAMREIGDFLSGYRQC